LWTAANFIFMMGFIMQTEIKQRRGIRELRRTAGATQFDVERLAGINRTRLSLAECGHIQLQEWECAAIEQALLEMIRQRAAQFAGILESTTEAVGAGITSPV
jgi:hypothetical protein